MGLRLTVERKWDYCLLPIGRADPKPPPRTNPKRCRGGGGGGAGALVRKQARQHALSAQQGVAVLLRMVTRMCGREGVRPPASVEYWQATSLPAGSIGLNSALLQTNTQN